MTAPIAAISAALPAIPTPSLTPPTGAVGSGEDFATRLSQGLQEVQAMQDKASDLAVQAATGSLTDVHDYTIASTEAGLAVQLTVAIRNKAVEAFQEIMRMQA
jgi:flagellar hook-basal body complex protein FliE